MDMQQALQSALQPQPTPHVRLRTLRKAAQRAEVPKLRAVVQQPTPITIETLFDDVLDGAIDQITKPRKVVLTKQGGYVRARYSGEAVSVFGRTTKEATSNLKFWR